MGVSVHEKMNGLKTAQKNDTILSEDAEDH